MFYKAYLALMAGLGAQLRRPAAKSEISLQPQTADLATLDAEANRYGNRYRDIGVIVGIAGALVVVCAVLPPAFQIVDEACLQAIGATKVALMALILVLVLYAKGKRLKENWIAQRFKAEEIRYGALQEMSKSDLDDTGRRERLLNELRKHIGDQLAYNSKKADIYENVEHLSDQLSWVAFGVALIAAVLLLAAEHHCVPHWHWLILLTAALPAAVGCLHGVNGFLGISSLAESHAEMERCLAKAATDLETYVGPQAGAASPMPLKDFAAHVCSLLVQRDEQWKTDTQGREIKPG